MKKNKESLGKRLYSNKKAMFVLSLIINITLIVFIVWLSRYAKIKGDIFAMLMGVVVIIGLVLNVIFLMAYSKNIKIFRQLFLGVSTLVLLVGLLGGFYIIRAERSIGKLVNTGGEEVVEYSVISFSSEFTIDNMSDNKIGFLKQTEELEELFKSQVQSYSRTVEYLEYEDYNELLNASLDGEIQYALVPVNYTRLGESLVDEGKDPFTDTQVVFNFKTKVTEDYSSVNVTKEPFSVLLLGNNDGLSDSIILATVNPQTLRVTMTSLARDSYVPIACYPGQSRDKLNHSRGRGRQCMIDTVENFLGVEVDFYFETDFYALVSIVDALGGLDIESPIGFGGSLPIEGQPGKFDEIYVPQGMNHLDGKQTVTFARERYRMPRGDFDRQLNQQYVIREIASKLIRERNPERLVSVLEGASDNMTMSLTVDDLTSLLGYAITQSSISGTDPMNTFRIVQTQITGTTPMINGMSVVLPYQSDIDNAKREIGKNLSTEIELNDETSFNFTINKPYLLAKRPTGGATIDPGPIRDKVEEENDNFEVPTFTSGYTKEEIKNWGSSHGVEISFRVIDKNSSDFRESYANGQIIHQTVDAGVYKKKPESIGISIVEFDDSVKKPEGETGDGGQANACKIPELVGTVPTNQSTEAEIDAFAANNPHLAYNKTYDPEASKGHITHIQVKNEHCEDGSQIKGWISVTIGSKKPETPTPTPPEDTESADEPDFSDEVTE